ncbi:MAG TPA: hypothetical protein VFE51_18990 [Verrucomicrobiae bacterium]|nr:hypothetical protein [Verrucomicrobiae bacterium]
MIDTANHLFSVQSQTPHSRAASVTVADRKRHAQAAPIENESSVTGSGTAGPAPVAEATTRNATVTLPPILEQQQAIQATEHARALIQAQARAALVAQANASSQSVPRLLS